MKPAGVLRWLFLVVVVALLIRIIFDNFGLLVIVLLLATIARTLWLIR